MIKSELLNRLQEDYRQWEALLAQIGMARMDQPGVVGYWSMKDLIAHLTDWDRWLVTRLQAAQHGEPEPAPAWPANLQTDDEINAWIYASNHPHPLSEVLGESRAVFQQILTVIKELPDDARVEMVEPAYYLVWINDQRFPASDFFGHFRDEHEADVRAWLARVE
jgi:hypothetical protein